MKIDFTTLEVLEFLLGIASPGNNIRIDILNIPDFWICLLHLRSYKIDIFLSFKNFVLFYMIYPLFQ